MLHPLNKINMGHLDDKYLDDISPRVQDSGNSSPNWRDIVSGDPSVTSREDIINPYAVVNPRDYALTRRGRQQYESDLARVVEFQKQQQAAYEEWYNSPEQAAIREREAGLNPDLIGLDNAGDASSPEVSDSVPGQGLPTNGEMALNVVNGITSVISSLSSVAGLATAFTDIPLKLLASSDAHNLSLEQLDSLNLSNRGELARQMSEDIAGLLGTAVQSHLDSGSTDPFDYDSFFADDKNFAPLESSYGSYGSYAASLALARQQSLKYHKSAAELQKGMAQSEWDFANIIADPRLTGSQKLTSLQLRPYVQSTISARKALDDLSLKVSEWESILRDGMSVELAIDAANAQNRSAISQSNYTSDYYDSLSGELVADFENYVREVERIGLQLRGSINQGYLDMYNSDPNGLDGYKAAYLFGNNGGSSWEEAYYLQNVSEFVQFLETNRELLSTQLTNEKWERWLRLADLVTSSLKSGNNGAAIGAFKLLSKVLAK